MPVFFPQTPTLKSHLCEPSSRHAITLLYTILLALLTYLRVCSAFYFTILLLFSLVFRHLIWDGMLRPQITQSSPSFSSQTVFVTCETLSLSIPFVFSILMGVCLIDFFVPLTGRAGGHLPPDLAMGVIVAVLVCLNCALVVSRVIDLHTTLVFAMC